MWLFAEIDTVVDNGELNWVDGHGQFTNGMYQTVVNLKCASGLIPIDGMWNLHHEVLHVERFPLFKVNSRMLTWNNSLSIRALCGYSKLIVNKKRSEKWPLLLHTPQLWGYLSTNSFMIDFQSPYTSSNFFFHFCVISASEEICLPWN